MAYFAGIWAQAANDKTPGQPAALRALAPSESGMTAATSPPVLGWRRDAGPQCPGRAQRHEIVAGGGGVWRFTVELMRRWVAETRKALTAHEQPAAAGTPDADCAISC